MKVWGLPPWWEGSWVPWHGRGRGRAEPLMQRALLGAVRGTQSSQARGRAGGYRATEQLTKQE